MAFSIYFVDLILKNPRTPVKLLFNHLTMDIYYNTELKLLQLITIQLEVIFFDGSQYIGMLAVHWKAASTLEGRQYVGRLPEHWKAGRTLPWKAARTLEGCQYIGRPSVCWKAASVI